VPLQELEPLSEVARRSTQRLLHRKRSGGFAVGMKLEAIDVQSEGSVGLVPFSISNCVADRAPTPTRDPPLMMAVAMAATMAVRPSRSPTFLRRCLSDTLEAVVVRLPRPHAHGQRR